MIALSATEVVKHIADLKQSDLWFIGQRKWTQGLANEVLALEKRLRASRDAQQAKPSELGLVFQKELPEKLEETLADFNRIYLFNRHTQIHIIGEDTLDSFFLAETKLSGGEKKEPVLIKSATDQDRQHPFLFASLLGAIPECEIKIMLSTNDNTWRFYHE